LALHAYALDDLGIDLHLWERTTLATKRTKRQDGWRSTNIRYLPQSEVREGPLL
jgi:hypothetical protein